MLKLSHKFLFISIFCCVLVLVVCLFAVGEDDGLTTFGSFKSSQFNGMWLWGSYMNRTNLGELKSHGINNIIVHEDVFTRNSPDDVVRWINEANGLGIKVHIWIQCFYKNGEWVKPVLENGSYNRTRFDEIIDKAVNYSKIGNVSGIHLDYLRYGGKAFNATGGYENACGAITQLITELKANVTSVNPDILLSAAVMPELESDTVYYNQTIPFGTYADAYYYGQNISVLGDYLDYLIPMVYKGNYKRDTSWIGATISNFVRYETKAKIIAGLQCYVSDDNLMPTSSRELAGDVDVALNNGAYGFCFFRYGLFNYIDNLNDTDNDSTSKNGLDSVNSIEDDSSGVEDNLISTGFPLIVLLLLFVGVFYGMRKCK